jgi:hypothetical protein
MVSAAPVCGAASTTDRTSLYVHATVIRLQQRAYLPLRERQRVIFSIGSSGLGYRRGQLELDTVGILEGKHVDAERCQPGDLTVRHALLVEQPHRLL